MQKLTAIMKNIESVIFGKSEVIERLLIALICKGHVLIEDVPGVGKTSLAKALAQSIDCSFNRIQFTPDLLPSDITGHAMFNRQTNKFEFQEGPIMSNLVLADEINRSSPKTQASLLEAMEERQVTIDSKVMKLQEPFMVIGTQNPVEYEGTFPLPEAQLDRFMLRLRVGYPAPKDEARAVRLHNEDANLIEQLEAVATKDNILALQQQVKKVRVHDDIVDYIVQLANKTRLHRDLALGVSPRGSRDLYAAARAVALLKQREYVLPDDVKELLPLVYPHRMKLTAAARIKGIKIQDILADITSSTSVPLGKNYA